MTTAEGAAVEAVVVTPSAEGRAVAWSAAARAEAMTPASAAEEASPAAARAGASPAGGTGGGVTGGGTGGGTAFDAGTSIDLNQFCDGLGQRVLRPRSGLPLPRQRAGHDLRRAGE